MTSTMLIDAASQLGQDVAATMASAQRLFEGDIGGALGDQGTSPKPPRLSPETVWLSATPQVFVNNMSRDKYAAGSCFSNSAFYGMTVCF